MHSLERPGSALRTGIHGRNVSAPVGRHVQYEPLKAPLRVWRDSEIYTVTTGVSLGCLKPPSSDEYGVDLIHPISGHLAERCVVSNSFDQCATCVVVVTHRSLPKNRILASTLSLEILGTN